MAPRRVPPLTKKNGTRTTEKVKGIETIKYNIRRDPTGMPAELLIYEKGKMVRHTIQSIGQTKFVIYKNTILILTEKGLRRATPNEQKLFELIMQNLRKGKTEIRF